MSKEYVYALTIGEYNSRIVMLDTELKPVAKEYIEKMKKYQNDYYSVHKPYVEVFEKGKSGYPVFQFDENNIDYNNIVKYISREVYKREKNPL